MKNIIKETLVKEIAEDIFTDGNGRKATRLILEYDGKTDNTGRNQISVEGVIRQHLNRHPLEKLVMPKTCGQCKYYAKKISYCAKYDCNRVDTQPQPDYCENDWLEYESK